MYARLQKYAKEHAPIRVALVGAGSMGRGIAWQLRSAPGMELTFICDRDPVAAKAAGRSYVGDGTRAPAFGSDLDSLSGALRQFDVLVEATNSIGFAAEACEVALRHQKHVVLMNAEVDLALGPWLHELAAANGVVLTSDAGDQHGVLARMMDEIRLWAFRPVMAGNIKGFLNRYATPDSLEHEAKIRRLNPVQCCAYTDGTKLSVEMALISNATGMLPQVPGMQGPTADDVGEVLHKFDFSAYPDHGVVDYILGARPGGGVFVVGHCDDPEQTPYLQYYKLGDGPYYLFYRPYHLCHLETPWAIANAVLDQEAVLSPSVGRVADVYAYAKRALQSGDRIEHAIGGSACYGMINRCAVADRDGHVPIAVLEGGEGGSFPTMRRAVARDAPLSWDDLDLPSSKLLERFRKSILPVS